MLRGKHVIFARKKRANVWHGNRARPKKIEYDVESTNPAEIMAYGEESGIMQEYTH